MITIDIKQSDAEMILAALKVAESTYTTEHEWIASKNASRINIYLRKQIYGFVKG